MDELRDPQQGQLSPEPDRDCTETLRRRAYAYLRAGILPRFHDHRLSGGLGPSAVCALCMEPIQVEDLRYLVDRSTGERLFELHVPCFLAWEHASLELFQ